MRSFVRKVEMGEHLMYEEMLEASKLMFNEQTESQDVVDFLVALSRKGETAHEVAALASVMKSFALRVNVPRETFMDNCGTGGDGSNSFQY